MLRWLNDAALSKLTYQEVSRQKSFNAFIENQQVISRENARTTAGFREMLAEPTQRGPRYQLMIKSAPYRHV